MNLNYNIDTFDCNLLHFDEDSFDCVRSKNVSPLINSHYNNQSQQQQNHFPSQYMTSISQNQRIQGQQNPNQSMIFFDQTTANKHPWHSLVLQSPPLPVHNNQIPNVSNQSRNHMSSQQHPNQSMIQQQCHAFAGHSPSLPIHNDQIQNLSIELRNQISSQQNLNQSMTFNGAACQSVTIQSQAPATQLSAYNEVSVQKEQLHNLSIESRNLLSSLPPATQLSAYNEVSVQNDQIHYLSNESRNNMSEPRAKSNLNKSTKSSKATMNNCSEDQCIVTSYLQPNSQFDFGIKLLCYLREEAILKKDFNVAIVYQLIEDLMKQLNAANDFVINDTSNKLKARIEGIKYETYIEFFEKKGLLPLNRKNLTTEQFLSELQQRFLYLTNGEILKRLNESSNVLHSFRNGVNKGPIIDDTVIKEHEPEVPAGHTIKISNSKRQRSTSGSNFGDEKIYNANTSNTLTENMLINPQNYVEKQHLNVVKNLNNKKFIASVKGSIDYPATIRRFFNQQKQQKNDVQKYTFNEYNSSLVLYTELGLLLFPDTNNFSYNININGKQFKCHDTLFSCLGKRLNVEPITIEKIIVDYISNNLNNESFLSIIYGNYPDSDKEMLAQTRRQLIDVYVTQIKSHTITEITISFLFTILPFIFTDYNIILFRFQNEEIAAMYYPKELNEQNLPCTLPNTISVINYNNTFKLLMCMMPYNSIITDSDSDDD